MDWLSDFGPEYGQALGRTHPMLVHFPIALLLVAGLIELLRFVRRKPGRSESAFTCLWIGAVSAAIAAYTGWEYAEHDPPGRSVEETVFWHRWVAVGAASTALLAVFFSLVRRGAQLREQAQKPWAITGYRVCLTLAVLLCGGAGHLGGELVYGEGYVIEPIQLAAERRAAEQAGGGSAAGGDSVGEAAGSLESVLDALPEDLPTDLPSEDEPSPPATAPVDSPADDSPADDAPPVLAAATIDFHAQVWPILEARCVECHGPRKQKGRLRLDSRAAVFDVEPSERVIHPGDAANSLLYQLVTLPADDFDIMPAKGEPLSPEQIDILRDWIDQGADWPDDADGGTAAATPGTATPGAATPTPATNQPAATALHDTALHDTAAPHLGDVTPPTLDVPALDAAGTAAAAEAVAALAAQGALAGPIAANTEAVEVDFSLGGDDVDDARLADLAGLESRLVWLSLARTAVTDAGLAALADFPLLRRVNLAETAVGDAGLAHLAGLHELESLNLFGTRVTDAGLDHLRGLTSLRRLYLWQSDVTEGGVESLQFDLPDCDIDFGLALLPLVEQTGASAGTEDEGGGGGNGGD